MGRLGIAEPAIGEPQDTGYDKYHCRQFADIHINIARPETANGICDISAKSEVFKLT